LPNPAKLQIDIGLGEDVGTIQVLLSPLVELVHYRPLFLQAPVEGLADKTFAFHVQIELTHLETDIPHPLLSIYE